MQPRRRGLLGRLLVLLALGATTTHAARNAPFSVTNTSPAHTLSPSTEQAGKAAAKAAWTPGAQHAAHLKHVAAMAKIHAEEAAVEAKMEAKEAHWAARAQARESPPPPPMDSTTLIAMEQQQLLIARAEKPPQLWAVLVCGSTGWDNYRHQASLYRMYQTLRRGIPEHRIITMFYDDIATHPHNPFPGKVYAEVGGDDVYAGLRGDFVGQEVNWNNLKHVLMGDRESLVMHYPERFNLEGLTSDPRPLQPKVLEATLGDSVLFYFSGSGSDGFLTMPGYIPQDLIFGDELVEQFAAAGLSPVNATTNYTLDCQHHQGRAVPCHKASEHELRLGLAQYRNVYAMIDAPHSEWLFRGLIREAAQQPQLEDLNLLAFVATEGRLDSYAVECGDTRFPYGAPCLSTGFTQALVGALESLADKPALDVSMDDVFYAAKRNHWAFNAAGATRLGRRLLGAVKAVNVFGNLFATAQPMLNSSLVVTHENRNALMNDDLQTGRACKEGEALFVQHRLVDMVTRHRVRSGYTGYEPEARNQLIHADFDNTSATGNSVAELREEQATVHRKFDMFMALLFKSGFTAEVYSKFKARDPSLYNDDKPLVKHWDCLRHGVATMSHMCGSKPNRFTHELVYIAAPLCNLPRFGANQLGANAKRLCQQLWDDKKLILSKKLGTVDFLTNAEGDKIAALDDEELEHDADVELAEAERVVNAEERELAPYGVDLNKAGGAYVPVALCDEDTRACSRNAALNRPGQHYTYQPAA